MNKLFKQFLILTCLVAVLVMPYFVFAGPLDALKTVGEDGGYVKSTTQYTFSQILGTAINSFLSLLGVIFIILMILGGYHWMTASGDEQKITKAKDTIRTAIIGLIIIVGSYAIWNVIWYNLIKV